jgi:translation elongation factor EF-G
MADLKTTPTTLSVESYLSTLSPKRQEEANKLIEMMSTITKEYPVVWGTSIIGFGNVHLKYATGREIDYFQIGFSVRKKAITLYLSIEVNKRVFDQLGKHAKGVGCLYINQLSDVDLDELNNILIESVETLSNLK